MTYSAVCFDLDDTLYPYPPCNEAGKAAAFERFRELGYEGDRERFRALYRTGRRETKRELSGTAATHERFLYFKRGLERHAGTSRAADALALGEAYWDGYVAEMALFDGVAETLADLRAAGLDVAVLTNLTTRIQLRKVAELGIDDDLDVLVTSEETGREKPASDVFTLALARLDCRPGEVLMVGDNPETDVEGANAVGIETALFNAAPDGLADHRQPDHHFERFEAVREVVL
jgi:putative hydrolase of the HAD superfamily